MKISALHMTGLSKNVIGPYFVYVPDVEITYCWMTSLTCKHTYICMHLTYGDTWLSYRLLVLLDQPA